MPLCADLHLHSTFSDGLLSPQKIVDRAIKLGIKAISITDHDTTAGVDLLTSSSRKSPAILPGVELSAHHPLGAVHILGYGIDITNHHLKEKLHDIQEARANRNNGICQKLQLLGHHIDVEELQSRATGQVGRPHIAQHLVEKKIVASEAEAFIRFLKKGAPCYVERKLLPAEVAIKTIVQANGIAALAHPASIDPTCSFLYRLIEDLCCQGLEALEVYHPAHNKKHIDFLLRICHEKQLLVTGGSDFHGRQRDRTEMGHYTKSQQIPYTTYEHLTQKLASQAVQ